MTRKLDIFDITEKIKEFLREKRVDEDGNLTKPTTGDLRLFSEIIYDLIEIKFEKDVDGDLPLSVKVIDHTTGYFPYFQQVPFDKRYHFEVINHNLKVATEEMDRFMKIKDYMRRNG